MDTVIFYITEDHVIISILDCHAKITLASWSSDSLSCIGINDFVERVVGLGEVEPVRRHSITSRLSCLAIV